MNRQNQSQRRKTSNPLKKHPKKTSQKQNSTLKSPPTRTFTTSLIQSTQHKNKIIKNQALSRPIRHISPHSHTTYAFSTHSSSAPTIISSTTPSIGESSDEKSGTDIDKATNITSTTTMIESPALLPPKSTNARTSTPISVTSSIIKEQGRKRKSSKQSPIRALTSINRESTTPPIDDYYTMDFDDSNQNNVELNSSLGPRRKNTRSYLENGNDVDHSDNDSNVDHVNSNDDDNNPSSSNSRLISTRTSHTSKFDTQGLGIGSEFCIRDDAHRDGVLVDIVKRKLLHQVNDTDTVALEVTRKEFVRRKGFVPDEELAKALENLLTAEDIALLSISKQKLTNHRQFDITRGSTYSEHIRHLFPADDFSGGIPPFTDLEIRTMFNRRPRFLNFVTENNPHGFDVAVLHRLASQTNLDKRAALVKQQITHRYWHLRTPTVPKDQPKISHRMHVHRTLNPRSNVFKHHYLKPRTQMTKQQRAQEQKMLDPDSIWHDDNQHTSDDYSEIEGLELVTEDEEMKNKKTTQKVPKKTKKKALELTPEQREILVHSGKNNLAILDEELYSQVRWSQRDIWAKLKNSGLTMEQIDQTRRFALAAGEEFLITLMETMGKDKLDPTLRSIFDVRREVLTKEDLHERRTRLSNAFQGFLANLDNPGRFAKVIVQLQNQKGENIVTDSQLRQKLLEEVNEMGGLDDLKSPEKVQLESILRQALVDPEKQRKINSTRAKAKNAILHRRDNEAPSKPRGRPKKAVDEDDLIL